MTTERSRSASEPIQYLSAREAAEILGVNRATVINWARQGKFGGYQYGARGIYRFDRAEIEAFIEQSRLPGPINQVDEISQP
ncbi:MAG TPA: helix-turn-helix domain-containing protein [Thermomicrobiales bacterium]|nr:helix-turn-helix domain-containing protein [Thermomicrobiales bacterium]